MNATTTDAIVLRRRDFQDADRILTVLTADLGKVGVIAKGARRMKSKLASGIELMMVSEMTLIKGRGSLYTLRSAQPRQNFSALAADYSRLQLAYRLIQALDAITEEEQPTELYDILAMSLQSLDNHAIASVVTEAWFYLNVLQQTGHRLNTDTDVAGNTLDPHTSYLLQPSSGGLIASEQGMVKADHIKLLRLLHALEPSAISRITGAEDLLSELTPDIVQFSEYHIL